MKTGNRRAILLVGSAADSPDLVYASGFRAPDPVVLLRAGGETHLVVPALEYGRAARVAGQAAGGLPGGVTVWTPDSLRVRRGQARRLSGWALGLVRKLGLRAVEAPSFFPLGVARRLERAGIRVRVARQELFPERAVKTADELRQVTESQQAAVIAMRAAVRAIAASDIDPSGVLKAGGRLLTSEQVRTLITKVLLDHRCLCREIIVAGGLQGADPHEQGSGPLRAHEPIVIDIFPQHMEHGYWGDITRTVLRGRAPARLRHMYAAVRAAQAAALAHVKAGVRCSAVHRAAATTLEQRGFKTGPLDGRPAGFIHSTGHGVGLAVHEAPSISLNDTRLKAGNVITIEPGLYYPEEGGIRIEDTIVVTSTGWRYLAPCEKRFEV